MSLLPELVGNPENMVRLGEESDQNSGFFESMRGIKESSTKIHVDHNELSGMKDLLEKDTNITRQHLDHYRRHAEAILVDNSIANPLFGIHQTVRNIFEDFTGQRQGHLQNSKFAYMCITHLSPLQAVERLLEYVNWTSHLYNEAIAMSQYILRQLDVRNHSIELQVFSKSFTRLCNEYNTPDLFKCSDATGQVTECPGTKANTICSISRPCRGKLHDCRALDDPTADVCISDFAEDRRYQYYRTSLMRSRTNLNYGKCHKRGLNKTERWEYLDLTFIALTRRGEICFSCDCTCEEGEYFINLAPLYSDVLSNKVITGAKFVLRGNVLELQIQQGKLLPDGAIDNVTSSFEPQKEILQKVSWNGAKRFLLSRKVLRPGRVLSGLQLDYGMANDFDERGSYIFLRILSSEYDDKNGRIDEKKPLVEALPAFSRTKCVVRDLTSPAKLGAAGQEFIRSDARVTLGTSNGVDGGDDWAGYIGIELHIYDTCKFTVGDPDAK
ncbi:hypothetical protein QAD02_005812 [Eretmocerus hayati]|uniref:Uncharacterized protein n=1 Tax=Eretmocerus hayati TaxID=131215 RepID=A0ACC2NYC6_9HYME|nr:hypothetical protein QAD02_005812 [Eretmocerus hayati]